MKPTLALRDSNDIELGPLNEFEHFIFDTVGAHPVTVCSDFHIYDYSPCETRILWVRESCAGHDWLYNLVPEVEGEFDAIFTHRLDWVGGKYRYCPPGAAWVEDWGIHPKSEMCSLIASDKTATEGHRLRHEFAATGRFDLWGRGYRPAESKDPMLKDYRYSLVIENGRSPGYFTEKLIDALLMGCVPVYWGDPEVGRIFDASGFLDIGDLDLMSEDDYLSRMSAIQRNFDTAKRYANSYDILWDSGLKEFA